MNNQPAFEILDMKTLSRVERALTFEDELVLVDNFEPMSQDADLQSLLTKGAFKIDFIILAFCKVGYMRVKLNFKEFRIETNDLLIVSPGNIVECLEIGKDCQIALIANAGNNFLNDNTSPTLVFYCKYLAKLPLFHLTFKETSDVMEVYQQMRRKMTQPHSEFTRMALQGCIQMLVSIGCEWATNYCANNKEEPKTDKSRQKIFENFLELLKQHFREERTIEFYATKLCFTPKYFSGIVREVSGLSAADWIKESVIKEAKALLKSKRYTATQVSEILNFPSPSCFNNYFKAATGCTPREFMLQ